MYIHVQVRTEAARGINMKICMGWEGRCNVTILLETLKQKLLSQTERWMNGKSQTEFDRQNRQIER